MGYGTHWLGRKVQDTHARNILRRLLREGETFRNQKQDTMVMPSEYKAKKLLVKTWHNPYTEKREAIKRREHFFAYERLWNR